MPASAARRLCYSVNVLVRRLALQAQQMGAPPAALSTAVSDAAAQASSSGSGNANAISNAASQASVRHVQCRNPCQHTACAAHNVSPDLLCRLRTLVALGGLSTMRKSRFGFIECMWESQNLVRLTSASE